MSETTDPGAPVFEELRRRLAGGGARLGVVGLGYVGLPVALTFAEGGFAVLGFDVDAAKVAALERGECYIRHLDGARLAAAREGGRFSATADFSRLAEVDALLICVPTPLTEEREPDLGHVVHTAEQARRALRPGQLVVLESTTWPGTTAEVVRPLLEESGLTCGEHFFLAYSPEREDPGNPDFATRDIPKVVGGVDAPSGELARVLYEAAGFRVVGVSSAAAAEAAKLSENIFRAVNIALVNELKLIYERLGVDVWEVLDAAATKPFGFMRFSPGPGWGGHCIPIDPFYLAWKARRAGMGARFIELAGEINVEMPRHVVDRLEEALAARGGRLAGGRVLLLGLAYKRDVDDPRESPAFEIAHHLLERGAEISYHDPHIPRAPAMRNWPELPAMESVALTPDTLAAVDAVVLVTDHGAVDYRLVAAHAPLIVDTRGVYRELSPKVVRA